VVAVVRVAVVGVGALELVDDGRDVVVVVVVRVGLGVEEVAVGVVEVGFGGHQRVRGAALGATDRVVAARVTATSPATFWSPA
jgi:hypothetical protein